MDVSNLSKREANKVLCRYDILRASRELFTSEGYDNAMIRDIAKLAKVSKATVYNYFPNKECLLIGTVEDTVAQMRKDLVSRKCAKMNSEEKLRTTMETLVISHSKYPALARRISFLNADPSSTLYECDKEMTSILKELVIACQEEGLYRKDFEVEKIIDGLMGLYFTAQFRWHDLEGKAQKLWRERVDERFDELMNVCRV